MYPQARTHEDTYKGTHLKTHMHAQAEHTLEACGLAKPGSTLYIQHIAPQTAGAREGEGVLEALEALWYTTSIVFATKGDGCGGDGRGVVLELVLDTRSSVAEVMMMMMMMMMRIIIMIWCLIRAALSLRLGAVMRWLGGG